MISFFEKMGINKPLIVEMETANKNKRYGISVAKKRNTFILELFLLNKYFVKFTRSEIKSITNELEKVMYEKDLNKEDKGFEIGVIINDLFLELFINYMYENNLSDKLLFEYHQRKQIPLEFELQKTKSPFSIQKNYKNREIGYIVIVHFEEKSEILKNKRLFFLQIHNALYSSKIFNKSPVVYLNRLEGGMITNMNISSTAKKIMLENRDALATIQTTTEKPLRKGSYEIINFFK